MNDGIESHEVPKPIPEGTHLVQTLRTFPPGKKYKFAPDGELGILEAYKKAIDNAREYIYIEDQFFFSEEIAKAIAEALKRGIKVIVVVPFITEEDLTLDKMIEILAFSDYAPYLYKIWLLKKSLEHIKEAIPAEIWFRRNKVIDIIEENLPGKNKSTFEVYYIYNPKNPGSDELKEDKRYIFVHSKLMVVDDIWAIISSANINRRSMTYDSEIGVAVIDGAIEKGRRKFARDLRIRLWAEHLKKNPKDLDDPMKAIKLWPTNLDDIVGHVKVYPRPTGTRFISENLVDWFWEEFFDPDGRE